MHHADDGRDIERAKAIQERVRVLAEQTSELIDTAKRLVSDASAEIERMKLDRGKARKKKKLR